MLRYRQTPKGIETQKRYKHSSKGIEANHRSNARTLRLGDMYLGKIGFTQDETKEMIEHGETD